MNEDNLRDRLGRLDPAPDTVAVEPLTTPSSQTRLEQIMNTPIQSTDTTTWNEEPPTRRSPWLFAAAAVVALVAAIGIGIAAFGGDDTPAEVASPPLQLNLGADDLMASCMRVEAAILADMTPAFAATATSAEGETVTLAVDRWYAGGDATTVELHAEPGLEALIAGFSFEVGQQYLITASNGNVNFCGYSGPATPELQAIFDEAFPS